MLDIPRDRIDENGDVLPSYEDEDNRPVMYQPETVDSDDQVNMEKITEATSRVLGEVVVESTIGRPEGLTDAEWFELLDDERKADRSGTHPYSDPVKGAPKEDISNESDALDDIVRFSIVGKFGDRMRGEYKGKVLVLKIPSSLDTDKGHESLKNQLEEKLRNGGGRKVPRRS